MEYYQLFYKNNNKIITFDILNRLNPMGLAIWFMDDGSLNYYGPSIEISTHGFSFEENQLISQWFKSNFDIQAKIRKQKSRSNDTTHFNYYLVMYGNDAQKFINVVQPFILPTMAYKIKIEEDTARKVKEYKQNYRKGYWPKYYLKNRKSILNKGKSWYIRNRSERLNQIKDYYHKNRIKILSRQANYRLMHSVIINGQPT